MESAYNHGSWTASFWQQMYFFKQPGAAHLDDQSEDGQHHLGLYDQMSAHSAAQELGSDGKAMCFSNNSGDSNFAGIGSTSPRAVATWALSASTRTTA